MKGGEDFGIENNDEEGGGGGDDVEKVIDLVDNFELQEYPMDKKDFQAYIKKYLKSESLASISAEEKTSLMNLVKTCLTRFKELSFYIPQGGLEHAFDTSET